MNRIVAGFCTIILIALLGPAWTHAQSSDTGRRPPQLRGANSSTVDTRDRGNGTSGGPTLITIPTIVMDRNGRYIANLRKEDFRIYDGETEQQVAYFAPVDKPYTVALMLDVSGSTQFQLAQIREAADSFVSHLRYNDRLMAVTFDGKINLLSDAVDVRAIRQTKLRIPAVTDGTVLYDAVDYTLQRLAQIPGRKAIVLFTDGVDQTSTRASLQSTLEACSESGVIVYTVHYNTLTQLQQRLSVIKSDKSRRKVQERMMKGYAVSEPYLRGLADKTGGRFFKADDLRDVAPAFEAITTELGRQYSLGYYLKDNSQASGERAIRVRVRYPNLVVRARESYATSPKIALQ